MGPGSEIIISNSHHHQYPNIFKHGKSNQSWFYDQMKDSVSAYEANRPLKVKKPLSPQYHAKSKPIAVTQSPSSNNIVRHNSVSVKTKTMGYGTPQQQQQQQHQQQQYQMQAKQSVCISPVKSLPTFSPPRQKAFTPPNTQSIIHAHSVMRGKEQFYAGAKFDTVPSVSVLPSPPIHWTDPAQRSQSQPSSPIPKMMQQKSVINSGSHIAIDLASLFGPRSRNAATVTKSASFPGESLKLTLLVKAGNADDVNDEEEEEEAKVRQTLKSASLKTQTKRKHFSAGDCNDKVKSLNENIMDDGKKKGNGFLYHDDNIDVFQTAKDVESETKNNSEPCHFSFGSESPLKYKDISDQLKNLLRVAA